MVGTANHHGDGPRNNHQNDYMNDEAKNGRDSFDKTRKVSVLY